MLNYDESTPSGKAPADWVEAASESSTKPFDARLHALSVISFGMKKCLRCSGELEKGYMIDTGETVAQGFTADSWEAIARQAVWTSGTPATSTWRYRRVTSANSSRPVTTYRCLACGRLESFA